jgi:hypothetical protein
VAQLGAGAVRPTQTAQGSQALKHDLTGVQGWHAVGSSTWAASQVPTFLTAEPIQTNYPLSAAVAEEF